MKILKSVLSAVIFLSFAYLGFRMLDPDLGWHLKVGEWILKNQSIQYFDEYSYTMPGFKWIDHEWLINAWLAWMYSKNLWWLVVLIFSAAAFIPFLFWLKRSKNIIELSLVFLTSILVLSFIGVRPQVISFLLFFIVLELLYRQRHLFLLPLIFLIWANLHAGFFSGLLAFSIFTAIRWLRLWGYRKSDGLAISDHILLLVSYLLSIAATLINPHSWKIYGEIFKVAVFSDVSKYIAEWQPALSLGNLAIPVFLGVFGFLVLKFYKEYPAPFLAVSLIFLALFLKSAKIGPLFLATASPILALGIQFVKKDILAAHRKKPFSSYSITLFQTVSALTLASIFFILSIVLKSPGFGYPEQAAAFLKEEIQTNNSIVRLFNDYGWGGYLIWNLPEVKVFIDGRMPHWVDKNGISAMKDYVDALSKKSDDNNWRKIFQKWDINTVLIKNRQEKDDQTSFIVNYLNQVIGAYIQKHPNQPIIKKLVNFAEERETLDLKKTLLENNWSVVYEDATAVILRKSI